MVDCFFLLFEGVLLRLVLVFVCFIFIVFIEFKFGCEICELILFVFFGVLLEFLRLVMLFVCVFIFNELDL